MVYIGIYILFERLNFVLPIAKFFHNRYFLAVTFSLFTWSQHHCESAVYFSDKNILNSQSASNLVKNIKI